MDAPLKVIQMCLQKHISCFLVIIIIFLCRVDELQIQDIQFLYGCSNPTIIVIYQDTHGRHIKTHEISLKEKEFSKVSKYENLHSE